jgi:hypothetical protein
MGGKLLSRWHAMMASSQYSNSFALDTAKQRPHPSSANNLKHRWRACHSLNDKK